MLRGDTTTPGLTAVACCRASGSEVLGTIATADVMCAFEPFNPHFQTGTPIPGRPRVGGMVPTMVDIPGFGDAAECRSTVIVGERYLLFLSNVSHAARCVAARVANPMRSG